MHNKITKPIAAAIIVIAGIVSLTLFDKTVPSTYAMTDVPELFRQANVVHIKGWRHYNLTDKGQKVSPQPIERWIDLENSRYRASKITVHAGPEEVKFVVRETILDGQYKMIINDADKSAVFYKMSDLQRRLETNTNLNHLFFGHLFPDPDILEQFRRTGQEEINGTLYDVWECEVEESPQRKNRYKYWLSTIDGSSGRFQSWYKNIEGPLRIVDDNGKEHFITPPNPNHQPWRLGSDFDKIECNVRIPENVFKLEVPEGYDAKNTKENAVLQELGEHEWPCFESRLKPRISFTLGDGSVILAWHSEDNHSPASQNELFEDLEFGGVLPKLPVEIYGLKPVGWIWKGEVTYSGCHLTSTQKNGKFIEWGLYVPNNPTPNRKQILGYDVMYKYNLGYEPEGTMGLMVDYGLSIESNEDFAKWVLGAMAELSDDGKAPEDITYEGVLELAEEIRTSMDK